MSDDSGDVEFDGVSALRPYVITAGHVSPVDEALEIEAQVATTDLGVAARALVAFERRDILSVCTTTVSVAEIAAKIIEQHGLYTSERRSRPRWSQRRDDHAQTGDYSRR